MAKVKCYSPLGVEEMKEPVDARECVENCGFTMEPPTGGSIMTVGVDVQNNEIEMEQGEVVTEEVESEGTGEIMTPINEPVIQSKRGRKRNK